MYKTYVQSENVRPGLTVRKLATRHAISSIESRSKEQQTANIQLRRLGRCDAIADAGRDAIGAAPSSNSASLTACICAGPMSMYFDAANTAWRLTLSTDVDATRASRLG